VSFESGTSISHPDISGFNQLAEYNQGVLIVRNAGDA
jgi:hypothetical protein